MIHYWYYQVKGGKLEMLRFFNIVSFLMYPTQNKTIFYLSRKLNVYKYFELRVGTF